MTRPSAAALVLAALVCGALAARPLAHGVAPATLALFWVVVLGQVLLPGILLARGARLAGTGDAWTLLGQGASLGLALQALAFVLGRAIGAPWLTTAVAAGAAAGGLALGRRVGPGARTDAPSPPAPSAATMALVLAVALAQPLVPVARPGAPTPFDLLFHAGTAAELRHRWPLQDPRVAGVPLHYHVLAYALPIEAADLASAPAAAPLLAIAPLFWAALLALQLSNAGRALFRDARAGLAGAAVAMFHADPGESLGLGAGAFNSHLATALYGSPTTASSFILLAGLVVALAGWLAGRRRRDLAALVLLSAAASGTKTTLLPVVLGGLAIAGLRALRLRRPDEARGFGAAFLAVAAAGAPFTLWQTLGAASYSRMAHPGFATAFTSSPFAELLAGKLGPVAVSGIAAPFAFLGWLLGFLGLAGVAAGFWLARRREATSPIQAWALAAFGVALAATLIVDAPGLSQLFLLYNGQLLVCLVAGAGLVGVLCSRPIRTAAAASLLLAALPAAAKWARVLPAGIASDAASAAARPTAVEHDYSQALAWLRSHATRGAVVFADNPSLLLSAFGEVRLYHETGLYTTRAWEVGPGREPWPERVALQERLLRRPDAAAVAQARQAIGAGERLLIVADAVQSRVEGGFVLAEPGPVPARRLFPDALFELRFANRVVHVYEARRQERASGHGPDLPQRAAPRLD